MVKQIKTSVTSAIYFSFVEVLVDYYNFALAEFAIEHVTNNFVEDGFHKIEDVVSLVLTIRGIIHRYP